jgi:tetratricopeptide (TPR) repeat protein
LGDFEGARTVYEKGLRFAIEAASVYGSGLMEVFFGLAMVHRGDGQAACRHSEKSVKYMEEAQVRWTAGIAWGALGYGRYLLGELDAARECIDKAFECRQGEGISIYMSMHHLNLGMIHWEFGELLQARNAMETALRLAVENHERHWEGCSKIWLGRLLSRMDEGNRSKGEENLLQGIKLLDELKIKPYSAQGHFFLGELHAATAQKTKALDCLHRARDMFQAMGMDYWLVKVRAALGNI